MALFRIHVPVGSLDAAFFAIEGFGIPKGRLRRTQSDLSSRAIGIAVTSCHIVDLIGLALDFLLTFA